MKVATSHELQFALGPIWIHSLCAEIEPKMLLAEMSRNARINPALVNIRILRQMAF